MTPPPGERSDRPSRSNPASRPARPPRTRGATTGRAVATKTARRPSPASRPARPARPRPQRVAKKRLPRQPHRIRLGASPRRLQIALLCGALAMSVVVGRLFQLQGVDAPTYALDAAASRTHTQVIQPVRGDITDRNGVVLATSVPAVDVTADQTKIPDPRAVAEQLATVLPQAGTVVDITAKLTGDKQFAYVARQVPMSTWEQVEALDLAGIYSQQTTVRAYPSENVASNVIGFSGVDGEGLGGIEHGDDELLAGTPGQVTYQRGADGREIPTAGSSRTDAVDGSTVRLTIDRDFQWAAQEALAAAVQSSGAESGVVVAMDPRTGQILALADYPTFDPNDPSLYEAASRGSRALSDVYEPGSTSKVMTAAAALEEGAATPLTRLTIPSFLERADRTFHDSSAHGTLHYTLAGAVAKSSNMGLILTAEKIGADTLHDYLVKFGIGQPSGLGFPGESRGILGSPQTWSGSQFYTVAFGQGLSVNAVQAASVYATIANGGVRVTPSLTLGTVAPDGTYTPAPAPAETRVVSERTARQVSRMLEEVVSEEGTAPMASIPGYRVAGKTGTANRVDPTCGCYRGYTASFIGYAPADDPRLVIAVTLQNPHNGHYGGMLGGPVFTKVMTFGLSSLGVPPTETAPKPYPLTWGSDS